MGLKGGERSQIRCGGHGAVLKQRGQVQPGFPVMKKRM
jgi:hypothetical protein